jgi:hypothetical protein
MIQMPRRSVTRFFIPLIDVLTLMFCIFLLMPLFNQRDEAGAAGADSMDAAQRELSKLKRENETLRRQLRSRKVQVADLRAERDRLRELTTQARKNLEDLQQLRKEMARPLTERFAIQFLGVDPANGSLHYIEPDQPETKHILANEKAVQDLIARRQKEAAAGKRRPYFLLVLPRKESRFPVRSQLKQYRSWLSGVDYGIDAGSGGS